jgi:putative redox protein
MIDKAKELNSSISLLNDRLHFNGMVGDNDPVSIDYTPPLGDNLGYTSLELLLLSLSFCVGSSVLTFLRKMKKTITGCEIHARGLRIEEHPTCFNSIFLTIELTSSDTSEEDLKRVLNISDEKYCPVWAMLKGSVKINLNYRIIV